MILAPRLTNGGAFHGWYKLADANGLTAESTLVEGQQLIIPVGVQRNANNATTFKPYDPLEVLGNTSPTSPKPPKAGGGCGVIGTVILVIIAIVVTIWTAGAASGLFAAMGGATAGTAGVGAVAAGAIGGAVGSIVSQAVGVATGIQEKFSWNAVALAAIGGGVGASGFGNAAAKAVGAVKGLANTAVSAMAGNALTQGISVATGLQDKFSWAGVAAAGIGAVAFQVASNRLPGAAHAEVTKGPNGVVKTNVPATTANRFGASMASTVADAATRSLIDGSDFGDNIMAALPNVIGQTIGEMVARRLARAGEPVEAQGDADESVLSTAGATKKLSPNAGTKQLTASDIRRLEEQTLTGPSPVENFAAGTTIVAAGENPLKIARRQLGPHATNEEIIAYADELQAINRINDPTHIPVGAELTLPEAQAASVSASSWLDQERDTGGSPYHVLNANEYIAGRLAFGDMISKGNLRAVRLVRGPGDNLIAQTALADPDRPAITIGNTIFIQATRYDRWNGDLSSTAESRGLLMHELTHVYQYQINGKPAVMSGVAAQAALYGADEAYAYYHRPNTTFRTETLEGQGLMVEHYARMRFQPSFQLPRGTSLADLQRRLAGTGIYGN